MQVTAFVSAFKTDTEFVVCLYENILPFSNNFR